MQWPPTRPGRNGRKFHLVPAASSTSVVSMPMLVEDQRELVHQRDVEVALRVLDDLRRLGHLDRRRPVHAGGDDRSIDAGDPLERLGDLARDDLDDLGRSVCSLVAGVDALGRIAERRSPPPLDARCSLEHRHADLLGGAGIHRRLVDDDRAALEVLPDRLARAEQRREVRLVVLVDRRRHRDDDEGRFGQIGGVGGESSACRPASPARPRPSRRDRLDVVDARFVDVESDRAHSCRTTARPAGRRSRGRRRRSSRSCNRAWRSRKAQRNRPGKSVCAARAAVLSSARATSHRRR